MPAAQTTYVGLFVTCLADLFRPSVAFSAIELLEAAGCQVDVPQSQTCCGQPGYNTGAFADSAALAKKVIAEFADYDYVVAPSGSCAGMIREHYPKLFKEQPQWQSRARELGQRTWELTSFLTDVMHYTPDSATAPLDRSVTYHDSCAGLRELTIQQQPRQLLRQLCNVQVDELAQSEVCCGFGGTFCAKMPDLSEKMVTDKLNNALETGADMLVGGDLGCLMNIAGRASRLGHAIEIRHVAEVLTGRTTSAGIGEGES